MILNAQTIELAININAQTLVKVVYHVVKMPSAHLLATEQYVNAQLAGEETQQLSASNVSLFLTVF